MCRYCEHPCWRDGGEAECALTDEQWVKMLEQEEAAEGVVDLMAHLQHALRSDKRRSSSGLPHGDPK